NPQDIGWTRKWIEVVWYDPARRGEALAVARSLLIKDQGDIETRVLLAQLLALDPRTSAEAVTEYEKVLLRAPQNIQALTGRAALAIWNVDLENAYRFLQMALQADPTNKIIAEQLESIKGGAEALNHSRLQLFIPIALTIIFVSVGVGYSARELTFKVYLV